MTYKQFLKELTQFKGRFRIYPDNFSLGKIRAIWRYTSKGYCPIAAVNVAHGEGNRYDNTASLGLPKKVYSRIVIAADGHGQVKIRKDLIKALGLE